MPNFDRFSVIVNSTYFGAAYQNIVHCQVLNEQNPANVMEDCASFVRLYWVDEIRNTMPNQFQHTGIVVRRLAPAISDVLAVPFSQTGNKLEGHLPGTCFYLLRYYCSPYERGTAYHWKLPGVSLVGNNGGNVTDEKVSQFSTVVASLVGGPHTINGNTFEFTSPHKRDDVPGIAKPKIAKVWLDGKVRNLRSRQVYA